MNVKKRFEYAKRRTQLFWEIEITDVALTTRSWGPRRKEHRAAQRFRSPEAAQRSGEKRILAQRERGFVELGGRKRDAPVKPIAGGGARLLVKKAIRAVVVTKLRAMGFEGTFPCFRRIGRDRHDVVWFWFGRAGGFLSVGLAVLPPRKAMTAAQDLRRAIDVRNKRRTWLTDLVGDSSDLHFNVCAKKWGEAWPDKLALRVAKRLSGPGRLWLMCVERSDASA